LLGLTEMKRRSLLFIVLLLSLLPIAGAAAGNEPSQDEMRTEVAMLVKAAEGLTILWPWIGPVPEVERVVAYRRPIAPLLIDLLADDPDPMDVQSKEINWSVQQQVALALCKIFGVTAEAGHVYMNRASQEKNASVTQFWVRKVYGR
jgi:hypothetical protein